MSKRNKISAAPQKSRLAVPAEKVIQEMQGPFHKHSFVKKYGLASIVLIILSFLLYYACIPYGYVLDDQMVITDNTYTKKGFGGIYEIFTTESFEGYFGEKKDLVQGNRYRPLSIASFAVEYGIMGDLNPQVSHVINILLYALTGIILMMVLMALFRNYSITSWWNSLPFVAALLFIAHPVHTEAVANIKGRDEILSMMFSLLSLYGSLRFMDEGNRKWLYMGLFSYFLGLLAKENAITFLAVIPVTVLFFSYPARGRLISLVFYLFGVTIVYLVLRFNTAGVPDFNQEITDVMNNPFLGMKPLEKAGSIMYTLGKYIQLLVWPHPLSHDYYPYAIPKISLFAILPLLSLLAYLILIVAAFRGYRSRNIYSYSIWFYLLTLTIVSNIVINLGTFMNERFIFMASAGYFIALAYFLTVHLPKLVNWGRYAGMGLTLVIFVGLGIKTWARVPVWKDALSLNEAAVSVSTGSARANSFMSTALFEKYQQVTDVAERNALLDEAEKYGLKAVEILPDYQYANLMLIGVASERYKKDNDINRYISQMTPIVLRRPDIPFIKEFSDYLKDRGHDAELFSFYKQTGLALIQSPTRRREFALQYLTYAWEINPSDREVNAALGIAYELKGDQIRAQQFKASSQ